MPIFGQVWLWSSLAFLLGALLCWLLVARPARNRVGELEAQLATQSRRPSAPARPESLGTRDDLRSVVPGFGDRDDSSDQLTRGYRLDDVPPPLPPERERLAPYDGPPNRDFPPSQEPSFGGGLTAPPEIPDTELAEQPRAVATQYLDVSAGSLTAPPEVPTMSQPPSDRGWFDDELDADAANQAPEDQPAVPRNRHHLAEPDEPFGSRLADDADEGSGISSALDGAEEPRSAIEDDSGGTVFTQRTHPIPGELIRQIDEAGKEELARAEADDRVDEQPAEFDADHRERTDEPEPVAAEDDYEPAESSERSDAETADESEPAFADREPFAEPAPSAFTEPDVPPEQPQEQTEVVATTPAVEEEPAPSRSASDLPRRVPQQNRITPGVAVKVEPTPNALPKRVPGKPRHHLPFGVEPTPEPVAAPAAVAAAVDEAPRSLFEPIIPATDEGMATPPPPHRLRQGSGGGRGPFGPGSAMPLPGGASPSPEFTIKASVAALRYCTPESPQFGRTVAEVWFRTAADAERVGFRPVG
ncbi:hypothetical protein [Actinophytocola sp.]|uniref:sunset domain-containing protein n=1 Tax=Actinophytocola sp. TaxID=1872138 RepID=UPI002ED0889B